MVKIDGKELLLSTTFLAQDDQDVEVHVPVRNIGGLNIVIRFVAGDEAAPSGKWASDAKTGVIRMEFSGWRNPLGSSLLPQELGDARGELLWFQLAQSRIGETNLVTFCVLIGGKKRV